MFGHINTNLPDLRYDCKMILSVSYSEVQFRRFTDTVRKYRCNVLNQGGKVYIVSIISISIYYIKHIVNLYYLGCEKPWGCFQSESKEKMREWATLGLVARGGSGNADPSTHLHPCSLKFTMDFRAQILRILECVL